MNNLYSQAVQATNFREKIERMSVLAGEFMTILKETRSELKGMQSPVHRNTYNMLLSKLANEILKSHPDEREMFLDEELLSTMTELVQKKIAVKLKTPGQIWDSEITNKICKMVACTPSDERKENPDLTKCLAEMPAFHPLRAGPGTWHAIHTMAASVSNPEDHMRVCGYIRLIQDNFYCEICKQHFGKYLEENPPEQILKLPRNNVFLEVKNLETGEMFTVTKLFEWTVNFHNKVNDHRVNYIGSTSPLTLTLQQAYKTYYLKQFDSCSACKPKKN
jgi:hypothetical protein